MQLRHPSRWLVVGISVSVAIAVIIGLIALQPRQSLTSIDSAVAATTDSEASPTRNVIVVLADDLDTPTWNEIPRLKALESRGMTFTNFNVNVSMCCPSRVSLMRGQYVHNHGVISNHVETGGGWETFRDRGEVEDCLPTWLQDAGVETALFGKYLNGYPGDSPETGPESIPAGWNEWFVPHKKQYDNFDYTVNDNGSTVTYGSAPQDYLTDVLDRRTQSYLDSRDPGQSFYLQINPTVPHLPAVVAPRHLGSHAGAKVPRVKSYNAIDNQDAPGWLKRLPKLTDAQLKEYDALWQQRLESTESIADLVDNLFLSLARNGLTDSTTVIITSDNGFQFATNRLPPSKRTAYDQSASVPMVVIGPGIQPGTTVDAMTSMIDVAPTVMELVGGSAPTWVDGRSLLPWLRGVTPMEWREAVLVENLAWASGSDPDSERFAIPRYIALRTQEWIYVEYFRGERELYNRIKDPYNLRNVYRTADPKLKRVLRQQLLQLATCSANLCRQADV